MRRGEMADLATFMVIAEERSLCTIKWSERVATAEALCERRLLAKLLTC
jgi:hypothetical protein